jgi:3-oxoacid CoA-transferase subunit B
MHCIKKVVTDLGVFDIRDGAFILLERAADVSIEEIQSKTAGKLIIPDHVGIVE